jgi:CBS domain-containing protein
MGEHDVQELDSEELRSFTRAVLDDLAALEEMLRAGAFDTGPRRIGAEQEMFFVDAQMRPAPIATQVLADTRDPRLTTEMATFNLEANLTPRVLGGSCLRELEHEMHEVMALARRGARAHGADVVLAGILPTLRQSDLGIEHLTPSPRFAVLNQAILHLRGGAFHVHIDGADELDTVHDSVLMESCNTSFQIHLQVAPDEFARLYNLAQVATAPVLAAAVNAPLLFGKRLWQETRIALFERSVDERSEARLLREQTPRVTFGNRWLDDSVLEIFHEDVARFRFVLSREIDEASTALWRRGVIPNLRALMLHNGTVWRWNRACYGITQGRPHLRIEQRALPAGPSLVDEVANAAFFFGLLGGLAEEHPAIEERIRFDDARANFLTAARDGLKATLTWIGGAEVPAAELVRDELLPLARAGLRHAHIDARDIDRYLGVIADRVERGRTGAAWMLASAQHLSGVPAEERDRALVHAMLRCQRRGTPGHAWPLARAEPHARPVETVGQLMSTDLFTLGPDDLVDLAASVMSWQHIRHVPVEDDTGRLVGLITHRNLLPLVSRGTSEPVAVGAIMDPVPPTVSPDTPVAEALHRMMREHASCVAVLDGEKLVGLVTEHDFMTVAARLLEAGSPEPAT